MKNMILPMNEEGEEEKYSRRENAFYTSSPLSRKEDVFGGDSSFHGRKTWKKFFKPTSWLHFLRNEGDPETPPLFHREGVKKEKEKRKREEERYIRNVKSFFYTFFLVICPHCWKKGEKRLKEERLRSISSFHYTPSDRILKETYPIVYSLLSRA